MKKKAPVCKKKSHLAKFWNTNIPNAKPLTKKKFDKIAQAYRDHVFPTVCECGPKYDKAFLRMCVVELQKQIDKLNEKFHQQVRKLTSSKNRRSK